MQQKLSFSLSLSLLVGRVVVEFYQLNRLSFMFLLARLLLSK